MVRHETSPKVMVDPGTIHGHVWVLFSWGGDIPISPIPRMILTKYQHIPGQSRSPTTFIWRQFGRVPGRSCSQNIAPSCPQNQPIQPLYNPFFLVVLCWEYISGTLPRLTNFFRLILGICFQPPALRTRNHDVLPRWAPKSPIIYV